MLEWFQINGLALLNVIIIDVVLAGDNAVVVGLAASRVAPEIRSKVIFWGIAGAVILRIVFALLTTQLLAITGILLFGGLLLLWVCWKMFDDIRSGHGGGAHGDPGTMAGAAAVGAAAAAPMSFMAALWQIVIADVSMSLDNVLAVAGASKGSTLVLVIGLAVAIVLMGIASHFIAKLLTRYPWISWVGLVIILYVALEMIWKGWIDVARVYPTVLAPADLWTMIAGRR